MCSPTTSSIPTIPDLTGQISGTLNDYVTTGGFGSVYRCDWRRPTSSPVKVCALPVQLADLPVDAMTLQVAVKVIRCPTPEQEEVVLRVRGKFPNRPLFHFDALETSKRSWDMGIPCPRKYCSYLRNNKEFWAIASPCLSVVLVWHAAPSYHREWR